MNKSFFSLHALPQTLLALALLAATQISVAQQPEYNKGFEEAEAKNWEELEVPPPPAPKPENLQPFYVGPTATQTFAVDTKSLAIGKDGVIRYTLVAVSQGGAKNISYEGIRCATFEKKIYALGREDGTWAPSRRNQWEVIVRSKVNRQHAALAQDYFCSNLTIVGDEKEMLDRMKYRKTLTDELLRE